MLVVRYSMCSKFGQRGDKTICFNIQFSLLDSDAIVIESEECVNDCFVTKSFLRSRHNFSAPG